MSKDKNFIVDYSDENYAEIICKKCEVCVAQFDKNVYEINEDVANDIFTENHNMKDKQNCWEVVGPYSLMKDLMVEVSAHTVFYGMLKPKF